MGIESETNVEPQTDAFGFLQSLAGVYVQESFAPAYSTVALWSAMDKYLLNNTLSGLALEALLKDPVPNLTKLLRMYMNNDL